MTSRGMNVITRAVLLPHKRSREWADNVIRLSEARDNGIEEYNDVLSDIHSRNASANVAIRI